LAGPWTISRSRADDAPDQDLATRLVQAGSGAGTVPSIRRRPATRWWAVPLLALMTAVAVLLAWATISLAERGVAASASAGKISAGPLVVPAPRWAAGLPRRYVTTPDPADQAIVRQFRQRFAAVTGQLLSAARRADHGRPVTAIRPDGLYGQPGHVDPRTGRPSWVVYLGLQSSAALGRPIDTIGSLMMGFLGKHSKIGPWPVAAGHRGGQANCTFAWLGGNEVSVCGWATGRTVGVVASPTRETSVSELAMLLIQMRYAFQRA
jgi:hypothetical protein